MKTQLIASVQQEIVEEILDRVDKEVIMGDETEPTFDIGNVIDGYKIPVRNELKQTQRQKLTQLRQSNNLLVKNKK